MWGTTLVHGRGLVSLEAHATHGMTRALCHTLHLYFLSDTSNFRLFLDKIKGVRG